MQRRDHARAPVGTVIDFLSEDGTVLAHGSLRNVCERGLGVAKLEPVGERTFARGDSVSVRFEISSGEIVGEARIQWINAGQRSLGLKMTPDEPSAAKLATFLESALPAN
jgi:hypothetical protein